MAAEVLLLISKQGPRFSPTLTHFLIPKSWERGAGYTSFLFPLDWETDSVRLSGLPLVTPLLTEAGFNSDRLTPAPALSPRLLWTVN